MHAYRLPELDYPRIYYPPLVLVAPMPAAPLMLPAPKIAGLLPPPRQLALFGGDTRRGASVEPKGEKQQKAEIDTLTVPLLNPQADDRLTHQLARLVSRLWIGDALVCGGMTLACVQPIADEDIKGDHFSTYYLLFECDRLFAKAWVNGAGSLATIRACQRMSKWLVRFGFDARAQIIVGGGEQWEDYADECYNANVLQLR